MIFTIQPQNVKGFVDESPAKGWNPPIRFEGGRKIIELSSSQIVQYLTCQQAFHNQQELRLVKNGIRELNTPPALGTYIHSILEQYYVAIALKNHTAAQAIEWVLNNPPKFNEEEIDEEGAAKCLQTCAKYSFINQLNGNEFIPLSFDSVEIGFSEILYEDKEVVYILTGRIDLLARLEKDGPIYTVDHKSQGRRNDLYSHLIQFRNYSLVASKIKAGEALSGFIINYLRLTKDPTFERNTVLFSPQDCSRWQEYLTQNVYYKIHSTWETFESGLNRKRNYAACPGSYGYKCQYTQICEPMNEFLANDQDIIKNLYHIGPGHVSWEE